MDFQSFKTEVTEPFQIALQIGNRLIQFRRRIVELFGNIREIGLCSRPAPAVNRTHSPPHPFPRFLAAPSSACPGNSMRQPSDADMLASSFFPRPVGVFASSESAARRLSPGTYPDAPLRVKLVVVCGGCPPPSFHRIGAPPIPVRAHPGVPARSPTPLPWPAPACCLPQCELCRQHP